MKGATTPIAKEYRKLETNLYLCRVAGNTVWSHMADDVPYLWGGFPRRADLPGDLPGADAAARVPKEDLQNPVRPIRPSGRVRPWRSPSCCFVSAVNHSWGINSSRVYHTLFQAVPAVDNMFREEMLSEFLSSPVFHKLGRMSSSASSSLQNKEVVL